MAGLVMGLSSPFFLLFLRALPDEVGGPVLVVRSASRLENSPRENRSWREGFSLPLLGDAEGRREGEESGGRGNERREDDQPPSDLIFSGLFICCLGAVG